MTSLRDRLSTFSYFCQVYMSASDSLVYLIRCFWCRWAFPHTQCPPSFPPPVHCAQLTLRHPHQQRHRRMGCRIGRPTSGAGWQQLDKVHSKISLRINVFTEKYQSVSFISVALFCHFPPQERHSFVKHNVLIRQVNSNHLLSYSKK